MFLCVPHGTHNGVSTGQTPERQNQAAGPVSRSDSSDIQVQWNRISLESEFSRLVAAADSEKAESDAGGAAIALKNAAEVQFKLGRIQSSEELVRESLELEKKSRNRSGEAESLAYLSFLQVTLGKHEESEAALKLAVSAILQSSEISSTSIANAHYFIGEVYYARGDIPKMLDYYPRAIEAYKALGDIHGKIKTLRALSYANLGKDDTDTAAEFARRSLELSKQANDDRGVAFALLALGLSQLRSGFPQDALNSFKSSESLFPDDVDRTEHAVLLFSLGRVYDHFGLCDKTIANYEKSLSVLRSENNIALSVGNLWSLGAVYRSCGNSELAIDYLDEALVLAGKLNKRDDVIAALIELAGIHSDKREFQKSDSFYRRALDTLGNHSHFLSEAKIRFGLGVNYKQTGQYAESRESLNSALVIYKRIKDKFSSADALYQLADVEFLSGNLKSAQAILEESIELSDDLSLGVHNSKLSTNYISNKFDKYELYLRVLGKLHIQFPDKGFDQKSLLASEASRARSLLFHLKQAGTGSAADENGELLNQESKAIAKVSNNAQKLTQMLSTGAPETDVNTAQAAFEKSEFELEEIRGQIKSSSPGYAAISSISEFDVEKFKSNTLAGNELLIEFFLAENDSFCWLIDSHSIRFFRIPGKSDIDSQVDRILSLLLSERTKEQNESLALFRKRTANAAEEANVEMAKLSEMLFGQFATALKDKRLIVVPDGKLHYVPFAALPDPNRNSERKPDKILLESNEIAYAPSASSLTYLKRNRLNSKSAGNNLLVYSDPVFEQNDSRLRAKQTLVAGETLKEPQNIKDSSPHQNGLRRLPGSVKESEEIVASNISTHNTSISGLDATREAFLSTDFSNFNIVHLATHGVINDEQPALSGIVMSQFDRNGNEQDGFIRLNDIYGLRLNADLVVLSACDTGAGRVTKGEGLVSLTSAFLQSGAKSVISSRWKVDDFATRELMSDLYRFMADENLTASEALRKAQLKMYRDSPFRSPIYWAAFSFQGDLSVKPTALDSLNFRNYFLAVSILVLIFLVYKALERRLS